MTGITWQDATHSLLLRAVTRSRGAGDGRPQWASAFLCISACITSAVVPSPEAMHVARPRECADGDWNYCSPSWHMEIGNMERLPPWLRMPSTGEQSTGWSDTGQKVRLTARTEVRKQRGGLIEKEAAHQHCRWEGKWGSGHVGKIRGGRLTHPEQDGGSDVRSSVCGITHCCSLCQSLSCVGQGIF